MGHFLGYVFASLAVLLLGVLGAAGGAYFLGLDPGSAAFGALIGALSAAFVGRMWS